MEPSHSTHQDISLVDCKPQKDSLPTKMNSPCHLSPVKFKIGEDDCGDKEMGVNEYYLGYEDESDDCDWNIEIPGEQDSKVVSPVIIDFCQNSDPEEISTNESNFDQTNHAVICSPLGSENCSYLSPDAVSLNSMENGCIIIEDANKEVGKSEDGVEINKAELASSDVGCENIVNSISPIQKCSPTIPFFVSSFDYKHKLGKLDVKNSLLDHYPNNSMLPCDISPRMSHRLRKSKSGKRRRSKRRSRSVHSTDSYNSERTSTTRNKYSCRASSESSYNKRSIRYFRTSSQSYTKRSTNKLLGFPITRRGRAQYSPIELKKEKKCTYKCPECEYTSSIKQIIDHYCIQHFLLTCPSCDDSIQEPYFLQHCKNCKSLKSKLTCPNCQLTCTGTSLLSLAMHINFSHPIKKCVGCGECFVPQKFIDHAKVCFFEPKHACICPFCEVKISMNNLSEHVLTHPIAECPLCNTDITQKEVELHMESCYLEKVNDSEESILGTLFNCPICSQRYSFEKMPEHLIKNHLSLNCVFCYMVMSLEEMREHVMVCSQKNQNLSNGGFVE